MADGDKPTLPQFVADVLRAVHRAKQFVPEIVPAGLDFLQRLRREDRLKQEQADPPSATANLDPPSATTTPVPVPPTNPTTPIPPVRRRAKRGEQRPRVLRALRKAYRPFGLPPPGLDHEATREKVISILDEEKATGTAPKKEEHLGNPSVDAIADGIEELHASAGTEDYSANPSRRSR